MTRAKQDKNEKPPLMESCVMAEFPSPAEQYVEQTLDLNELLVKHPAGTFFVRVSGDSMVQAGIFPGDILVVDRTLDATNGSIVIAAVDGEFTVKYMRYTGEGIVLEAANPDYKPITFPDGSELQIFGVVTACVRQFVKQGK
jgi:DNA polymerase V